MRNIERIKSIPIVSYLEHMGIKVPERGNICAFWRGDRNPSVSIDRAGNRWYDHGTGEYGSVIDLAMAIEGCSFSQAVEKLESGNYGVACFAHASNSTERKPAIIVDSVGFLQHPALLQYINERGISTQIARFYCSEVRYHLSGRPDRQYFAVGVENRRGGWELRNPYCKLATKKDYTFINCGGSHLCIFEGFFDMMAYQELPDSVLAKRAAEGLLVLNSVSLVRKFISDLKAGKMEDVSTVSLYLDADAAGMEASAKITEALAALRIRVLEDARTFLESFGPDCKDVNDALKCYQQQMCNNQNLTTR